jgi:hypothetical protein
MDPADLASIEKQRKQIARWIFEPMARQVACMSEKHG